MATREVAKKGLAAAADKVLRDAMPSLQLALSAIEKSLDDVRQQIFRLDAQVVNLRDDMNTKFERVESSLNDLQGRMLHVDGKLDGFIEASRQHTVNVMSLVERITRLEMRADGNGSGKRQAEG